MPPELHLPRKKHFRKPLQLSGSQSNNINDEYGTLFAVRILREKLLRIDMLTLRGVNQQYEISQTRCSCHTYLDFWFFLPFLENNCFGLLAQMV